MGAVYKRKRRSCPMCKPHKMGWEPKATDKQRQQDKVDREDIACAACAVNETHNARGRGR